MAAALAMAGAGPIAAQAGSIVGEVRTDEGVAVVAAEVTVVRDGAVVRRGVSDARGLFRFPELAPGAYRVGARALGYAETVRDVAVEAGRATRVELELAASAVQLEEIRVRARRQRARFEEDVGATVVELAGADIQQLPGLAEADVLRAVEVLPGVVSTSDFSAAFNVRGGAADQNLILLDGIPIYNPFHLGGLFSVFNADMVERAELMAGGFPARYGGRVSSVLDVRTDAGDGSFAVDAGVSLLASRAAISGGLPRDLTDGLGVGPVNGRLSFRRSYFDVILSPFFDFPYHLTDVQGVAEVWTRNGVWTVTGYAGADILDLSASDDFPLQLRLDWGNDVLGVRWRGLLAGLTVDGRVSSSAFDTEIRFPDFEDTRIGSRIADTRGALDLGFGLGSARLGLGGELVRLEYDNRFEAGGTVFQQGDDRGWLAASYAELTWESAAWRLELGGRLDVWDPESTDPFVEPAPRLSVKRFFGDDLAVKLAAGRYTQALHSLRDEEVPIGIDLWVTAGERAPVVVSDQAQVGIEAFRGGWSGSAEAYYRTFDGVIATNNADDPNDPEDDFLVGSGASYGLDLLIRREPAEDRRVDGWVTISLLRARRSFPDPLTPEADTVSYPPIYDRRVDVDLVLRAPFPGGIQAGLRFNFGSGLPFTRPVGAYPVWSYEIADGQLRPQDEDELQTAVVLGDRNAERYPSYHRLDISFRKRYEKSWGTLTPFLDLLNVYNRRDNVLFYFYEYDEDPPVRTRISMLPVVPTFGVEVRF
ncbi:MAG: TonB-dependent receptor [Candidatus Longimicrobiales bacterium M2_2A_002]